MGSGDKMPGLVPLEGFDPPRYEVGDRPGPDVLERLFAQAESP